MENNKFHEFFDCTELAFQQVSETLLGIVFSRCDEVQEMDDRTFCVIIGMVGKNKGRVRLEAGANTVRMITENMNGEPCNNIMDMYMCLSEFANMICGNAVTVINNKYKGNGLRLTPPAVFSGSGMQITTPRVTSTTCYYHGEYGPMLLDIGFEGA